MKSKPPVSTFTLASLLTGVNPSGAAPETPRAGFAAIDVSLPNGAIISAPDPKIFPVDISLTINADCAIGCDVVLRDIGYSEKLLDRRAFAAGATRTYKIRANLALRT